MVEILQLIRLFLGLGLTMAAKFLLLQQKVWVIIGIQILATEIMRTCGLIILSHGLTMRGVISLRTTENSMFKGKVLETTAAPITHLHSTSH